MAIVGENHAFGIRYVHVPKTGGTWIKRVLRMRSTLASDAELLTIGSIRHPVDWHASAYRFFVIRKGGPHPIFWAASDEGRRTCSETIRAIYEDRQAVYQRAMRRAARNTAELNRIMITAPQDISRWYHTDAGLLQYLRDHELSGCDHVISLERIRHALQGIVAGRVPQEVVDDIQAMPPVNTTLRPDTSIDVDEDAARIVQTTHSAMMEEFGYG